MTTKAKYAKIGERVKIVTAKRFIRCGYPLTSDILRETRGDEIFRMMHAAWKAMWKEVHGEELAAALGPADPLGIELTVKGLEIPRKVAGSLESAACFYLLEREHWGGRERKLFEEDYPEIADAVVTVAGKRSVQTGEYERASYSHSWDGEGDYDPPYLGNAKTHVVYAVTLDDATWNKIWSRNDMPSLHLAKFEVLASNCGLVEVVNAV